MSEALANIPPRLRQRLGAFTSMPGLLERTSRLSDLQDDAPSLLALFEKEVATIMASSPPPILPWAVLAVCLLQPATRTKALDAILPFVEGAEPVRSLFLVERILDALPPSDDADFHAKASRLRALARLADSRSETFQWCTTLGLNWPKPKDWAVAVHLNSAAGPTTQPTIRLDIAPHPSGWRLLVTTPRGRFSAVNGIVLQNDLHLDPLPRLQDVPFWLRHLPAHGIEPMLDASAQAFCGRSKANGRAILDWLRSTAHS